jgi:hypothetical protein
MPFDYTVDKLRAERVLATLPTPSSIDQENTSAVSPPATLFAFTMF